MNNIFLRNGIMKKITLKSISIEGKAFNVYLGNGTAHTFTSNRSALQFLNQTSQFLTSLLYELRLLNNEIYSIYQNYWGYFEDGGESFRNEEQIKENFLSIEKSFSMAVTRSPWTNGNIYSFRYFSLIIEKLRFNSVSLNSLARFRSQTFDLYKFDSLFRRLLVIEGSLNNYGIEKSYFLFKLPVHIEVDELQYIPKLKIA